MGFSLLRFWPHITIAVASFALGAWLSNHRCKIELGRVNAEFLQFKLDQADAVKRAAEDVLARERDQVQKNEELSLANAEKDAAITKLATAVRERVGALRLCQSTSRDTARVPTGEDHRARRDTEASPAAELPTSDAGSFVELATDADRVMNQLETCQSWARSLVDFGEHPQ